MIFTIKRHRAKGRSASLRVVGLALALAGLTLILVLFPTLRSASAAATLKADYRFQNTRSSSVGGAPALQDIGPGTNTFPTSIVDGISHKALRFPEGNGLKVPSTTSGVVSNTSYTVVMLFGLDNVSGFRRLIDFKNATSDRGLYVRDGALNFFPHASGSTAPIEANRYHQVVLTRSAASSTVVGYVDGVQQFSFTDSSGDAVIAANDVLRFFRDNESGTGSFTEHSAGSVARIRLYNGVLSATEVGALDRLEPTTFVVNSNEDNDPDISPSDGKCVTEDILSTAPFVEECTLRAAIEQANATTGKDTIAFNIPTTISGGPNPNCDQSTKVCTISPDPTLPAITEAVTIDGYTQGDGTPGTATDDATENTLTNGTNAALKIQLDGANRSGSIGLRVFASNVTVRGLIINRFSSGEGINIFGSANQVVGNFIGTDATGTQDLGNHRGVNIGASSSNNTIGGTTPASRNLISGNDSQGVEIFDDTGTSTGNKVQGNLIGTKANGTAALGNSDQGVEIFGASNTTVGGSPAARNVISANGEGGVVVFPNITPNDAKRNRILFNSIYNNVGLGIDLVPFNSLSDGVTANDNKDPDTGANALQNFPTLIQAATTSGETTIEGRLNSTPNKTFTIQFFSNPIGDASGFGEGKTFIGQRSVTTRENGNATFTFTATERVQVGNWVTATATDSLGNTSEFSEAVQVDDQLCPC